MTHQDLYDMVELLEKVLLPCPFCGGDGKLYAHETDDDDEVYIMCGDCYTETARMPLSGQGIADVSNRWNNRINNKEGE